MSDSNTNISSFMSRVRLLIRRVEQLKGENKQLTNAVEERDMRIVELESLLQTKQAEYESLMAAKILSISDNDMENTRKRINSLIRTVNQCITILNEQN